jgi:hypothetical protein
MACPLRLQNGRKRYARAQYSALYLSLISSTLTHVDQSTQTEQSSEESETEKGTCESSTNEADINTAIEYLKSCPPEEFSSVCNAVTNRFPKSVKPITYPVCMPSESYMYMAPTIKYYYPYGNYY